MRTLQDRLDEIDERNWRHEPQSIREKQRDEINGSMWREDITLEDLKAAIRWLTEPPR